MVSINIYKYISSKIYIILDLTIRSRKNKITGVFSAVLGLFGLQYGTTQAVVGATIGTGVGKGTAELMLNGV